MTPDEFTKQLKSYTDVLDPALYAVLVKVAAVLDPAKRRSIVDTMKDTKEKLDLVYDYVKKRITAKEKYLQNLEAANTEHKKEFREIVKKDESTESAEESREADKMIANL